MQILSLGNQGGLSEEVRTWGRVMRAAGTACVSAGRSMLHQKPERPQRGQSVLVKGTVGQQGVRKVGQGLIMQVLIDQDKYKKNSF